MIGRRVGCQRRQPTLGHHRLLPVLPSPPAGPSHAVTAGHTNAPSATVPRRLLPCNRARATVTALTKEFGVSFDCVTRRTIAPDSRDRLPPASPPPARGARLDDWLGPNCRGAGVGDLSRRLQVTPRRSAMRSATTGQSDPQARCVRRSPAPLSNRGPADKLSNASTAFTTPSRTLRGTAAQHRHKPRHGRHNRSRTLDARASGTTARTRRAP